MSRLTGSVLYTRPFSDRCYPKDNPANEKDVLGEGQGCN